MIRRTFALTTVSFTAYMMGFVSALTVWVAILIGPDYDVLDVIGRSAGAVLFQGTVGGAVVTLVTLVRRKLVLRATLRRWLSVVAGTGILHCAVLATPGFLGVDLNWLAGIGMTLLAPVVSGTLLVSSRPLGLRGPKNVPTLSPGT